tara:strand:- start:3179 stop:4318 length:1140 start_codon:yes stop_codon:yes gene_type:complete
MRYGSVCSGIESASIAWEPLGLRPAWFSEIEPFPSAVLAHHWPNVANMGDMTKVADMVRAGLIPAPEVLVGGTPCQAFSVAGLRKGMDDARGQLTLTYVDILNAIDEKRDDGDESVCVWENVPGVLSSKDNAFGCFLGALAGEECELQPPGKKWTNAGYVLGPQRAIAWRILDAQYFGVAQRRRRVFVVASARDGFDPRKVLFESDGVRRDTPPSRETGSETTKRIKDGPGDRRWPAMVAPTLNASFGDKQGLEDQHIGGGGGLFVPDYTNALTAHNGSRNGLSDILNGGVVYRGDQHATHVPGLRVRRLTPIECERLQGFPDNHTRIPYRNKPAEECPDGPRYKALGNSKAVPCVRFVGLRLIGEWLRCAMYRNDSAR